MRIMITSIVSETAFIETVHLYRFITHPFQQEEHSSSNTGLRSRSLRFPSLLFHSIPLSQHINPVSGRVAILLSNPPTTLR